MKNTLEELQEKMNRTLSSLEGDLKGLRTGRASVNLLDPVQVEAYGDRMPLSQLATVASLDSKTLSVQVWDKTMVKAVEKAIVDANLGITPNTDGQVIRLPIPTLNEERRKEYVKLAQKYGENSKISIRNIRRDAIESLRKLEKANAISEDELHSTSSKIQDLTDDFTSKIDGKIKIKEQEIMVI